jgi:hypothetical protein
VIVPPEHYARWLDHAEHDVADLLAPLADGLLQAHPVSARVNAVRNDDAALIEPVAQASPSNAASIEPVAQAAPWNAPAVTAAGADARATGARPPGAGARSPAHARAPASRDAAREEPELPLQPRLL